MRGISPIVLAALVLAPVVRAQNPPHLAYAFPAGGARGSTVRVQVAGQFLNAALAVYVSGGGVQARLVEFARPMSFQQANDLRQKMQELQKQTADPSAQKQLVEVRRQLATFNRNVNPALAEIENIEVRIDPAATPGPRELRIATPQGLSSPLVFSVGEVAEFVEKQTDIRTILPGMTPAETAEVGAEKQITLPVTVNGRIMPRPALPRQSAVPGGQFTPGDSDRYRFEARRGQHIVAAVEARALIPYLADAVPGWFQPSLRLYDSAGHELASASSYRFNPDPVLDCRIPQDGAYTIEIRDALYRGREDFVYRMSVGELPWLGGIFPLGGPRGKRVEVELLGVNLGARKLAVDARKKAPGLYAVRGRQGAAESNALPFQVDTLAETREKEPNDEPKKAQRLKTPILVNGRIQAPGDVDVYSFQGRAGETVVAEVTARRLGSPLDSVLRLTDAAGRQIAFNDDHDDRFAGLLTHQADSWVMATLPAKGTYYLEISDTERKGGPEYAYRLRVGRPRPDFELLVSPSAITSARGTSVPVTVTAVRKDGFDGPIAVELRDGPRGLVLDGATLPPSVDQVRLTLTVPPNLPAGPPAPLALEGKASVEGREVRHTAVPADDRMQAFAYHHLVEARDLRLALINRVIFRPPPRVLGDAPLRIPAGGSARLRVDVRMPSGGNMGPARFELRDPPEGVTLGAPGGNAPDAILIECDGAKAKPGTKGNLILGIYSMRPAPANNPAAGPQRVPLGVLPAVPFEIVAR